jgi:hypothetical protein
MTIAVLTEASDRGVFTYSCPATELVGHYGSLILWPRSEKPIKVPYARAYSLHFEELA